MLSPRFEWGEAAWLGLATYIFAVDIALLMRGQKPMTEIWREALRHPLRRWVAILAWVFTTKHLFFGGFLPWLDPFHGIAASADLFEHIIGRNR
jgi:hypothetical protein